MAWAPDGRRLAAACDDNKLRVLLGEEITMTALHEDRIRAVAWSRAGVLASAARDTVRAWAPAAHTGSAALALTFALGVERVAGIAFSPCALYLAAAGRDAVLVVCARSAAVLWRADAWRVLSTEPVRALAWA